MAGSVNKVILVGNLGRDPELRKTPGGASVTSFTLATTDKYTDKSGQRQEQTEWHNVVCWNRLAEISSQYLKKGSSVFIEGKLQTRSWEDNGQKKYKTEIIASGMQMLDKMNSQGGGFANQGGYNAAPQSGMNNQGSYQQNRTAGFGGDSHFGEPPMDAGFGGDDFGGFPDSGFGGGFGGGSAPVPQQSAPRYNAPAQHAPVAPALPVEDDLPF